MDETISRSAESAAAVDQAIELGEILGQRKAFASLAGRCSAADAECIRRLREEKLFKRRSENWEEFCPKYLGISKAQANRVIRHLEEFGPDYFTLAQLIHITPECYRAIAASVHDGAVHLAGESIKLLPENTSRLSVAVDELHAVPSGGARPVRAKSPTQRMHLLTRQFDRMVKELEILNRDRQNQGEVMALAGRVREELRKLA